VQNSDGVTPSGTLNTSDFAIFDLATINNFDVFGNLILNLKPELKLEFEFAISASCAISLLTAAGAYRVVTLCAQLRAVC